LPNPQIGATSSLDGAKGVEIKGEGNENVGKNGKKGGEDLPEGCTTRGG